MSEGPTESDAAAGTPVTRRSLLQLAGVATMTGLTGGTTGTADGYDDCMDDIEAAKEYAQGRVCTEQFARMRCPYDEDVTYGAANGCEISYLQEEGWDTVSPQDGNFTAILDRFEVNQADTNLAVLLLEEEGTVVDDYVVEESVLPEPARHEGAVLDVVIEDADLMAVDYLEEETADRKEAAAERFDRLSKRLGDEDEDEERTG